MPVRRNLLGVTILLGAALLATPPGISLAKGEPASQAAVPAPRSATDALSVPIEEAALRPKAKRPASVGVSASLKSIADQAMAADPALTAMLSGTTYTVVKEGPWTRVRSAQQIGVVRMIKLATPVNTAMRPWPVIVWDKAADTYRTAQFNASYLKVATLTVFITDQGQVVQLSPGPESSVVEGSGNEWANSVPGGSD